MNHQTVMSYNPQESLLVDGYISRSFTSKSAEYHMAHLLKTRHIPNPTLLSLPGRQSQFFVVQHVPGYLPPPFPDQPGRVIDRTFVHQGTIVPQTFWVPQTVPDRRQYVELAELQLPIFFESFNGRLGYPLDDAVRGRFGDLRNGQIFAPLKSTTHIRIGWPGYGEFRRQVQTHDETSAHNPITIARFAQHFARSVDAFLRNCQPTPEHPWYPQWRIGLGSIDRNDIIIIGAVHVSLGSWMPIIQLNRYIF